MRVHKLFLTVAISLGTSAFAQEGTDIIVGASLPLSGFNAAAGKEGLAAANAYFEAVNKAGGIGGRKIVLRVLDDEFNATKAAENAKKLIDDKAIAIFNCWGTSSCSAMMPIITEAKIPLVTGISGGGPMRQQPGRYAFNMRATTEMEIARMVNQMVTIGQNNIALVYQNDPFGKSGQVAAASVFAKANLKPVAEIAIERDSSNQANVIEALTKLKGLNGIILVAAPPATVKLIPAVRKAGVIALFYNLAAQANSKVVQDLGEHTTGVVFTTLVPSPWKSAIPIVKEYQQIISSATGKDDFSYLGMEIFINAHILVDGLRKAGKKLTRESLVDGLETMGNKRFGPIDLDFGRGNHDGSSYVGLTIINRQGGFVE